MCEGPRLSTRDDRITVRRVPRRVVSLLLIVATAAILVAPPASAVDRPGYVAVTDAEALVALMLRDIPPRPPRAAEIRAVNMGTTESLAGA